MISSVRRSFEQYIRQTEKIDLTHDKTLANLCAKYMDEKVIPKTIFILNYDRHLDHSALEEIANKVNADRIYVSYIFRNKFKDVKNVVAVKKNTEEFFKCLSTSQYIVVDSPFSIYYIPKKDQCVITVLDNFGVDNFENKAVLGNALIKSNIVTAYEDNSRDALKKRIANPSIFKGTCVEFKDIVDTINSGNVDFNRENDSKKNVLIVLDFTFVEKWFPILQNQLDNVDYDTTNVTLIANKDRLAYLNYYLNMLDERVNVLPKVGWFLITEDDRKKYDYINTDLIYFEDYKDVYREIPKEVFVREFVRITGNKKYDELYIYGNRVGTKNNWILIAQALDDVKVKHIVYDPQYYKKIIPENKKADEVLDRNVTKVYSDFDNIWFWNVKQKEEFEEYLSNTGIKVASDRLKDIKLRLSKHELPKTRVMQYEDKDHIIFNEYFKETINLDIVPKPSDNAIGIIIESFEDVSMENLGEIKKIARENQECDICLFDIYEIAVDVMDTLKGEYSNICGYIGAEYYYVLAAYINKFVVFDKNSERINELELLGKKII